MIMVKRLLSSMVGGLIGVVIAWHFQDALGTSPALAYGSCTVGGLGIGYVASMLFDVFAGSPSGPAE
jgi:hypothetical protein